MKINGFSQPLFVLVIRVGEICLLRGMRAVSGQVTREADSRGNEGAVANNRGDLTA